MTRRWENSANIYVEQNRSNSFEWNCLNFLNLLVALLTSDMVVGGKKRSSGKTGQTSPATDLAPPIPSHPSTPPSPPRVPDWGKHFSFLSRPVFPPGVKRQKKWSRRIYMVVEKRLWVVYLWDRAPVWWMLPVDDWAAWRLSEWGGVLDYWP